MRLYLDSGDLMVIADGDASPHDQLLRETIAATDARVVYSWVHLVDLLDADNATRRRWANAIDGLGPAEWIFIEEGKPKIEALRWPTVWSTLRVLGQFWSPIRAPALAARMAARAAHLLDESPPLTPRKLRANVAKILDGQVDADHRALLEQYGVDLDQMAAQAAVYGMSRDDILRQIAPDPRDAAARGDIVEAVRRRLDADRARKPAASDLADAQHLDYLPYVDVFTADRYVAAHIDAAQRVPGPRPRTCAHVLRTRHLDEVARVLRKVADDTAAPAGS
ncbi:MAG TPA: hypothetical protein VHE35_04835 [Kofleriaceae bacterium]|nr:hypothetical protein [Kofleriaceae bacterium]